MKSNLATKYSVDKTDAEIKADVLSELKYEPMVKATDIGVLVKNGTLTLNGYATSYAEKWNAVRASKRVAGVKAIADEIKVQLPGTMHRTDSDIAAAAASQLKWCTSIPEDTVTITVSGGWITLEGQVEQWYQRNAAETAIHYLVGVKGVSNLISVKPVVTSMSIERDIQLAFERNAMFGHNASKDAKQIHVKVSGNKVTLQGKVRNYAELDEADLVAWNAPGVSSVDNQLTVEWNWF